MAGASPETPQEAATRWVAAIMDQGDLRAAWPLTDATLRLVLAQDWVWTHRHRPTIGHDRSWDELARGLAALSPAAAGLWAAFAEELIGRWQKTWAGLSAATWATWDQPEVVGLDLEMVTFMERDGDHPVRFEPGRSAFARRLAMRHTDEGWQVAGVNGDQLFVPGWPPSLDV
ncbi:MAG: hypothetical protein M3Y04_09145 [Actinomycetota bacterium]|nr:hypothetical protein [Actinomycetota bacterium]